MRPQVSLSHLAERIDLIAVRNRPPQTACRLPLLLRSAMRRGARLGVELTADVEAIYSVQRVAGGFNLYRVTDGRGVSVGSCDQFLTGLRQRDCSAYTQRAYAIGLAHFFNWLHHSGGDPNGVTSQIVGRYISEFARGGRQGAITSDGVQKAR